MNGPIVPGENLVLTMDNVEKVANQLKDLVRGEILDIVETNVEISGRMSVHPFMTIDVIYDAIGVSEIFEGHDNYKYLRLRLTNAEGLILDTRYFKVYPRVRKYNPHLRMNQHTIYLEQIVDSVDSRKSMVIFLHSRKSSD